MSRALLAVAFLAGCGPSVKARPVSLQVDPIERTFTVRASRSRVRLLEPPAAPDTHPVAAARPAPQRAQNRPASGVQPADRWALLRQCESGGNYANKRSPVFRGGYQFSRGTWASVGGSGDPADASPAEQDMRALMLYARRGASPWPVCGRWL